MQPIILASASPRRKELLAQICVPFVVEVAPDVERDWDGASAPIAYAREQAHNKTWAIAQHHPEAVVLGADTVVIIDHQALGKPLDASDAARMLTLLSGRTHQVVTAFCLCHQAFLYQQEVSSAVTFQVLSAENIQGYLRSLEWQGKAGAYAIQGIAGAFVSRVEGSYTNVVGLPVTEVVNALLAHHLLPSFPL
jgi:septum formation protein